jgi:hypothetical protein
MDQILVAVILSDHLPQLLERPLSIVSFTVVVVVPLL